MPTDTSHTTPAEPADEHVETQPGTTLDPWETHGVVPVPARSAWARSQHAPSADRVGSVTADWLPPHQQSRPARAERLVLQTRIAALERTVDRRETQLDSVVDQYEAILEHRRTNRRTESDDRESFDRERATAAFTTQGVTGRLRGVVGRAGGVVGRVRRAVGSLLDRR